MNIFLIPSLLILSAFFSGSETAFFSLGKIRFKQIEKLNTRSAKNVIYLLSQPTKLIITIIIGNTLVNIAASSIVSNIICAYMGERGVLPSIILMMAVLLIFGEVTPKMLALARARSFSFLASYPLLFFEVFLAPARFIFHKVSSEIVKIAGIRVTHGAPKITAQEIRYLFSLGKSKGLVKEKEQDMIENIMALKNLSAADIMTPRINIASVDMSEDENELCKKVTDCQYSRLPVYMHELDNIVGVIHAKDLLLNQQVGIKGLLRKPFFVPESMRADRLLTSLQTWKTHMAIVTDEYGITSGVVTIEDILEEIVGEIRDEYDFESPYIIRKIEKKSYLVKGETNLKHINEEIGLGIESEEVYTIGGYIILKLGKIPKQGDYIEEKGYLITVNEVSKNRVKEAEIRGK